jgi:N-methylhydantoinase A
MGQSVQFFADCRSIRDDVAFGGLNGRSCASATGRFVTPLIASGKQHQMSYYVGIDVGGTFTDICVANQDGQISVYKTPTMPDIGAGVIDGLKLAAQAEKLELSSFLTQVDRFGHGSTVAVNALLQRRGVRTGLITTRGFADTLWIARMMAMTTGLPPEHYTHYRRRRRPDPLIERRFVREVEERVDFQGKVVVALDSERARKTIRELLDEGLDAIAICTLWSFRNPVHERRLREIAHELAPELYVSVSSEVVPVIKEYERMATTVVNAYLGPVVRSYLTGMKEKLRSCGLTREFFMLNSIGGVIPLQEAALKSIQLLSSGPAGGALASQLLAKQLDEPNVLTADMGGTSFDAGVIVDGEPLLQTEAVVGNLNLLSPMIGIRSIGTGGGSIAAAIDGMLKVGPQSAGSYPGPACYGRGGTRPTVTDADLVLGYLNPAYFLNGEMSLDAQASFEAIRQHIAEPLGLPVLDAAAGIREVADQQMADLLRQSTLERGYDPREFCMFAYGGAGPVHACAFGREAGVRSILIPATAPVFSAQGILAADMRLARQRSILQRTTGNAKARAEGLDSETLEKIFMELEEELNSAFVRYGLAQGSRQYFLRSVGMRYSRQVHEVAVPVVGSLVESHSADRLIESFDRTYEHRFGKGAGSRNAVVEITNCHLQLVRVLPKVSIAVRNPRGPLAPGGSRRVYLKKWIDVPVYRWDELPLNSTFAGPALVDAPGTTAWIAPGHGARVDQFANLRLETNP